MGIGASAGGLAAFEAFFSAMPAGKEYGMAFVLVQHLAPDHKSILAELIMQYTSMKVCEVEDGMEVLPDHAYIIPPNRDMAFLNGTLQLLKPVEPRGLRLPIDFFFRSLAQDQRERAICIVLSGTGSDGTLGVRAIKGEGGMVMAQTPDTTEFDGMPRSAIATGLVDFVLPPSEMPDQLIAYTSRAFGKAPRAVREPLPRDEDSLKKIFILLRARTGHDFSQYKQNTIMRRVERRMAVNQVDGIDAYIRYLQKNSEEVDALFRDMLIGVTSFFRDPEAFEAMSAKIIPRLFTERPSGKAVRVWVPGCSTGEEAYSIAILLFEYMERVKPDCQVQVFATDIDALAIEVARAGVYPASISTDISPERLKRFFIPDRDSGTYRIQKSVRDALVFSVQDVIKDPPFSRIDLVSFRNVLIYMGGTLQKKLMHLFYYSLNPDGVLFLGTSETIGEFVDLFAVADRKWKLYHRKEGGRGAILPAMNAFVPPAKEDGTDPRKNRVGRGELKVSLQELAEQDLLRQYAPPAAVVNERGEIVYIYGRTGRYLEPAMGEANVNIVQMAREGLRRELSMALHKIASHAGPVHYPGLRVKTNGDYTAVNLTVRRMLSVPGGDTAPGLILVIFEEAPPADQGTPALAPGGEAGIEETPGGARIAVLEKELQAREEHLQTTLEEMETSNEELKSTNEELQSVNEELQSTNEELETSKEELQSVNEELATVNAELQQKVADLTRVNNDMNNLLAGTGVGTIFVDCKLCIQRFTPTVTRVINLIKSDVGRPVGHIVSNLVEYNRLVEDVQSVLDSLVPLEVEVQTAAGAWYLLRILPYRTLENVIEGAVITFVDITEIRQARDFIRENETLRRLAVVMIDAIDAIIVQDLQGRILAWNPGAERMYGWSEAEALSMNIRDLVPEELRGDALTVIEKLGRSKVLEPYRARRITRDGRTVEVWLTAIALKNKAGEMYAVATKELEADNGINSGSGPPMPEDIDE